MSKVQVDQKTYEMPPRGQHKTRFIPAASRAPLDPRLNRICVTATLEC
jgi:hypothetical protein